MPSLTQAPPPGGWYPLYVGGEGEPNRYAGLQELQSQAPAGYTYDIATGRYVKTPTAQGQAVAQYQQAAMPGLTSALSGLSTTFGGGGGVGTAGGGGSVGGVGTYGVPSSSPAPSYTYSAPPSISPIDTSAATSAVFGRAKDVAGQTARSALDSLRGVLGETGQLGGGAETKGARQIVEDAAAGVSNVTREQAIQQAQQAQQNAIAQYQGALTMRGQDIGAQQAQAQLAQQAQQAQADLSFRQQQLQYQQQLALMQTALSGLGGLKF